MTAESNGAEYRCFITDSAGEMASTRIATVKLDILDWTMEYNTSGQRTKRISDEKTYTYIYADDKLMRMTVGDDVLDFSYDANGAPLTMTYNGTVYYYITNLQGDVTSLQQANGNTGAQYAYDAWGNIIAMTGTLAELNPLRYRGYVYDQETGFYYLNSRYYDPLSMRMGMLLLGRAFLDIICLHIVSIILFVMLIQLAYRLLIYSLSETIM